MMFFLSLSEVFGVHSTYLLHYLYSFITTISPYIFSA